MIVFAAAYLLGLEKSNLWMSMAISSTEVEAWSGAVYRGGAEKVAWSGVKIVLGYLGRPGHSNQHNGESVMSSSL